MLEHNNPIIVPWDFSETADFALQHALKLSNVTKSKVILVHIVSKDSEISKGKFKLQETVEACKQKHGVKLDVIVKSGSIFSAISDTIKETKAAFAVMGTHGMKGMQKFTGSWALKVIVGSACPFIVVQQPPIETEHFDKIVFPIDFKFTEKEKLVWAEYISKFTEPKFYLTYMNLSDEGFRKKVLANAGFAQKYLAKNGIQHEMVKLEGKSLADESIKFAKEIDASLVLIATTRNIRIQDYVLGADEQKMIANSQKLPVMCVNPNPDLFKTGGFN